VPKCSGSAEQGFSVTVIIFFGPVFPGTKSCDCTGVVNVAASLFSFTHLVT